MIQELLGVSATLALGDVGRYGGGGPAKLARQPERLGPREGWRRPVARYRKIHRFLPDE
jgi:hypothetical protein